MKNCQPYQNEAEVRLSAGSAIAVPAITTSLEKQPLDRRAASTHGPLTCHSRSATQLQSRHVTRPKPLGINMAAKGHLSRNATFVGWIATGPRSRLSMTRENPSNDLFATSTPYAVAPGSGSRDLMLRTRQVADHRNHGAQRSPKLPPNPCPR